MPPGHNLSQQIQSNCSSQISELDSQDSTMQDLHLGGSLLRDIARQNISHINIHISRNHSLMVVPILIGMSMLYNALDQIDQMMLQGG